MCMLCCSAFIQQYRFTNQFTWWIVYQLELYVGQCPNSTRGYPSAYYSYLRKWWSECLCGFGTSSYKDSLFICLFCLFLFIIVSISASLTQKVVLILKSVFIKLFYTMTFQLYYESKSAMYKENYRKLLLINYYLRIINVILCTMSWTCMYLNIK